jgi:L-2-hydroxycarboxylate dehydrogenase (NAD+)
VCNDEWQQEPTRSAQADQFEGRGMAEVTIAPDALRDFATDILVAVGMERDDAAVVSHSLVDATRRGVDSHGIVRLLPYVTKMERGGTRARPDVRLLRDRAATAVVDGGHGMGQVVGTFAMAQAIERARRFGVGMVVATNSEHFGAAGYYARQASDAGLVGFASTNAPPVMAPWGGRVQAIGNNPVAFAVPTRRPPSLVLDMSMSRVAGGKVRFAAKTGERIPEGWIIDRLGVPSTDPNDLPQGALLADGHKGYGLAVIVEVLCGALSGAAMLSQLPNWLFSPEKATTTGHAFIAIDVDHFVDREQFLDRVEAMRDELRAVPTAQGVDCVLVPGDVEAAVEERRSAGLPIPAEVYADLVALGERYDVDPARLGAVDESQAGTTARS